MSSLPTRDPKQDHLLTPENAALVIIDYQPTQVHSIRSMPQAELIRNVCALARLCRSFGLPIVLSTVNVNGDPAKDTIPSLVAELKGLPSYDRTTINSWEDREFLAAVQATGRRKFLFAALWTEACLTFPALDALKEGFEVYPVVDAVGGTSVTAHESALRRMEQRGAQLTSVTQVACELQRDWARPTAPKMVEALKMNGAFPTL